MMLWTCLPCGITMPTERWGTSGNRLACMNCGGGWLSPATRQEREAYEVYYANREAAIAAAAEELLTQQFIAATLHELGEIPPADAGLT